MANFIYLETYWVIKDLRPNTKYNFRAKSRNAYGDSNWSSTSDTIDSSVITELHVADKGSELYIYVALTALFICAASLIAIFNCGN